jgi:methyl-accepting chemotaxis protein
VLLAPFIKLYKGYWLALLLPMTSAVVLSGWVGFTLLQTEQQRVHQHQAITLSLQLDTLANQLAKEHNAADNQNLALWHTYRQQTKTAWQQVMSTHDAGQHAALTALNNTLTQLYWQHKQNPTDLANLNYAAVQQQLAHKARQFGSISPACLHLVQLRQLQQGLRRLQDDVRHLLSNNDQSLAMAMEHNPESSIAHLNQVHWLTEWTQPGLAPRELHLYQDLFKDPWLALHTRLASALSQANPFDPQLEPALQQLDTLNTTLDTLITDTQDQLTTQLDKANASFTAQLCWVLLLGLGLPLVGTLIMGWVVYRQHGRLTATLAWVQTLTCGNLTALPDPTLSGTDTVGHVVRSLDELRHHWRRTLLHIQTQCNAIANLAPAPGASDDPTGLTPMDETDNDVAVLADDASHHSDVTLQLNQLGNTSQQLVTAIEHWQGDTQTLSQHMAHMAAPLQQHLAQFKAMLTHAALLSDTVEQVNDYARQCQALVDTTTTHATRLLNDPTDLQPLQNDVRHIANELTALQQQLVARPVHTRLNSKTAPESPVQVIQAVLDTFRF